MKTYNLDKVIAMVDREAMDVEMATGHFLQHIRLMYDQQKVAYEIQLRLERRIEYLERYIFLLQSWLELTSKE